MPLSETRHQVDLQAATATGHGLTRAGETTPVSLSRCLAGPQASIYVHTYGLGPVILCRLRHFFYHLFRLVCRRYVCKHSLRFSCSGYEYGQARRHSSFPTLYFCVQRPEFSVPPSIFAPFDTPYECVVGSLTSMIGSVLAFLARL